MSSGQFPPSSPFLDHHEEADVDPFSSKSVAASTTQSKKFVINSPFNKGPSVKKGESYPTPNPSSSTGVRSSSPARVTAATDDNSDGIAQTPDKASSPQESAVINRDNVEYKNPLHEVLRAKVSSSHTTTLGRSSRCDYFVKSKYASRVHLKLQYDAERNELTVLCKGFNGCIINFGTEVYGYVKQVSNHLFYFQKIQQGEIKSDDEIFHDVSLFRDEQITVPYSDSLTLDIKGHITVLNVVSDDSETEDELPVLNTRCESEEPARVESVERISVKLVDSSAVEEVDVLDRSKEIGEEVKLVETVSANEKSAKVESKPVEASSESKDVEVPADFKTSANAKQDSLAENPESRASSPQSPLLPLQPKSESSINKQQNTQLQSRRRKAEPGISPQKKKPQIQHQQPREKISQLNIKEIVSTVEDIESVTNVLINHLAFSRLSQTPLYTLQTVSAVTQNLSRTQLRAVLFQINCIGTIYRKGKDAAGKPLDEEYYYDVEKDEDFERTKLVSSIKGASGLRNCRKTHKQYFWRKPTK